jgi:hypothetical protein
MGGSIARQLSASKHSFRLARWLLQVAWIHVFVMPLAHLESCSKAPNSLCKMLDMAKRLIPKLKLRADYVEFETIVKL